jgi:hypothetical protein
MESTGIMQQVRELLCQGRSSGEIIKRGYAPGTVYRVQREMRRKAYLAQRKVQTAQQSVTNIGLAAPLTTEMNAMVDRLRYYQEDNQRFQSEIERLNGFEEESNSLQLQITKLSSELESCNKEKEILSGKRNQLMERNEQLDLQLNDTRLENIELKRYLGSKNCGWRQDFLAFKERGTAFAMHCNYQSPKNKVVTHCRLSS